MIVVFLLLVLVASVFLGGCSSTIEKQLWDNVSEVREFVLYGKEEGVATNLICGRRESNYKIDGYTSELVSFGIITITIVDIESLNIEGASYILYVGTEKYSGDLVQNPFDKTLVSDIGKIIDRQKNVSIDIFVCDTKYSMKLKSVDGNWNTYIEDCMDILIENYEKQLKTFVVDDVFEGELYLKIMNDYDIYGSDFYYYVSVVGRNGSSINMIISPITGEVLASNSTIVPD